MIELCCEYLYVRSIWPYVFIMSRSRFTVNPHTIVAWMSSESTHYSCLNVKELLARNRHDNLSLRFVFCSVVLIRNKFFVSSSKKIVVFYDLLLIFWQRFFYYFFFHPLKKNNYANHAFHQDNQDKQPIGLWLKQLSRLKSFGLTQSSISVSRSWNIECPYKLLASESVIYEIAFVSIVRFQEIIISFSVAFTNYRNSTPYRAFNELILSIAENIITI